MELPSIFLWWNQSAVSSTSIALVLLSLSIGYAIFNHRLRKDDRTYPPYAPGNLWTHMLMRMNQKTPYWMLDLARELNTQVYRLSLPGFPLPKTLFVVGDPTAFRAILTDPLTTKPMRLYGHFRNIYGGSSTIFTTNVGPEWHVKRKAVAPAFSPNHIKRMNRVALEKTERWINETLMNVSSFDVAYEMIGIVLSALSETAFEYDMSKSEKDLFGEELKLTLKEFAKKSPIIPFRNLFGWFIPERQRAYAAAQNLLGLTKKMMDAYSKKEPSDMGTIIQIIMESDAFPTEDEKTAELLEFLVAGHDTTAYSIAFTLIELAKNPEEQTKLRASLSQLPPENWSRSEQLRRVVKEGMRLHPVARSIRVTGRDIMTSQKEILPKGSLCVCHFLLLFRNPAIFEEPDSFRPSRWENPTREMIDSLAPFSLGKQNCVGQSLAREETFGIIARICSEFELWVETEGKVDFFLTVKPVGTRLGARRWCKQ